MVSFLHYLFELIVPSNCVICQNAVSVIQNNLCSSCLDKFRYLENNCALCSSEVNDGVCNFCNTRAVYFDKNISIFEYNDVVKELLHQIKFNNLKYLFKHFSKIVYMKLLNLELEFDLITYIPMNKKKKWTRGYNQSEIIAKDIASNYGVPCCQVLDEKSNAGTQRELGYKERFINVLGRYEVKKTGCKQNIKEKRILVIDDVFTSGATLNEVSRKLKDFGVKEVFTLTIAKTKTKNY